MNSCFHNTCVFLSIHSYNIKPKTDANQNLPGVQNLKFSYYFFSSRLTLLAQASSSQEVSCNTRMISLISALIFSTVKFRFFKASSIPWFFEFLVVTKIFIAIKMNKRSEFDLLKNDGHKETLSQKKQKCCGGHR